MANVIIYPQGNGNITDPHMLFDDGTNQILFDASGTTIVVSSTTNSNAVSIGSTVVSSGASITDGSLYVGGIQMINSSAVWVGPSSGLTGAQGAQGAQGPIGSNGAQGAQGTQGVNTGAQGVVGAQGSQGVQGSQGSVVGAQGPQGAQGPSGAPSTAQGAIGNPGATGPVGAPSTSTGALGATGTIGPSGAPSSQGSQGAQGTGGQGSQGAIGVVTGGPGSQGAQGEASAGSQGSQGAAGAQGSASDKRFKNNIKKIENVYEKTKQIEGVNFVWDHEHFTLKKYQTENLYDCVYYGESIGFVAQKLELVVPEVVWTDDDGYKTVQYDLVVSLGIGSVQEQQKRIDKIYKRINKLKELISG